MWNSPVKASGFVSGEFSFLRHRNRDDSQSRQAAIPLLTIIGRLVWPVWSLHRVLVVGEARRA